MEQNTAPNTTTPPVAPAAVPVTPAPKRSFPKYPLLIIGLILIVIVGFVAYKYLGNKPATPVASSNEVVLPSDAVIIQSCADHKGQLYARASDLPAGPFYMVNDGKVIGIEYMLGKDQFLSGQSFKFLSGEGIKVDHVNIGLLSQGHEGYPAPHYHVDVYSVPVNVEEAIVCPGSSSSASASATTSPSPQVATTSASPVAQ